MTPGPSATARANRRAILLVLAASATFALSASSVKALDGAIPVAQIVFFRCVVSMAVLWVMVRRAGGIAALAPRNPWRHAERTLWGLMGMVGAFYSYSHMPLATATVLGFTMPLFLTLITALLLRQAVEARRWAAVGIGFAGMLLVARPEAGGTALPPLAVGAALMGAVGWALAMLSIRRMGEAGESGIAIVFWFALLSSVVSALATIPVWVTPQGWQWALLVATGLVSGVAQLLMTEAYRRGETTLLAPFEYVGLVWATLLGLAFWGERPEPLDLLGFAVLVGAGLFLWWRETRAGR
jgi:drug/metabolite transporter (DMT)-like permease